MKPIEKEFEILLTKNCLKHIEESGISLKDDNWDYTIPSGKGLVYTLPNGEFVLVPTSLEKSYPGIIFKNEKVFKEFVEKDFFPIDKKYMTWLEFNASSVKEFDKITYFFTSTLFNELKISFPFKDVVEIEHSYYKLLSFVKEKKNSKERKESIINSYGLSVIHYLVNKHNYQVELQKRYEIYNPYYVPVLIIDRSYIDVISKLHIAIQSESQGSFKLFSNFISLK